MPSSYYTLRSSPPRGPTPVTNTSVSVVADQMWGFDPVQLLATVEFPNDKPENMLRRSKAARLLAIRRLPLDGDEPPVPVARPQDIRRRTSHAVGGTANSELRDDMARREQLARLAATLTLQALYRAWQTRRKYIAVLYGHLSIATHRLDPPDIGVGLGAAYQLALPPVDPQSLSIQEKVLRRYYTYCFWLEKRDRHGFPPTFPEFAAAYIQALWRMWAVRKSWLKFKQNVLGQEGTSVGAAGARKEMLWKARKQAGQATTWGEAALKMQRAWRSYYNRKIYRFHRDLIKFRLRGEPRKLLKFINPQEADLMDASMGIHVRFRLGGASFPPSIFYKVFVHKSLIDMNAFSPRDYTSPESKQPLPVDLFDKTGSLVKPEAFSGWYCRIENNGWRPVSDKIFDDAPDKTSEASRIIAYHHVKLKRRQELERAKRARKLQWMRKMYQEGRRMIHAAASRAEAEATTPHTLRSDDVDDDLQQGPLQSSKPSVHSVMIQRHGSRSIPTPPPEEYITSLETDMDPEVLIKWTRALDFEEYFNDWVCMATSGRSEDPRTFRFPVAPTDLTTPEHMLLGAAAKAESADEAALDSLEQPKSRPWSGKSERSVRDLMVSQREMMDF
ncbi:hypothetical protein PhCBS80983_g04549 [Powellomyces hirtus]|uniref:Uncharacterized protein n=1 Tax=Powellomyces hirtus TaxID=109895 RepID=A0A507DY16_9FUNG|nr:hypothetical protein PhCBS80983_g04549 [Powellomyces hirtus]